MREKTDLKQMVLFPFFCRCVVMQIFHQHFSFVKSLVWHETHFSLSLALTIYTSISNSAHILCVVWVFLWVFILCHRSWLLVSFFSSLCPLNWCRARFESFSECLMNLLKNVLIIFLIFFSFASSKIVAIVVVFVVVVVVICIIAFSSFISQ